MAPMMLLGIWCCFLLPPAMFLHMLMLGSQPSKPGVLLRYYPCMLACHSSMPVHPACALSPARYVKDRSLGQQLGRARFTQPEDR